jgi:hypothetical protein
MLLCNHLILHLCMYLDINTLFVFLLYSRLLNETKNRIVKNYCLINNKCNNFDIQNYYNTILYFQNKHSYNCFTCNKQIITKYYLVICTCISLYKISHGLYT